MATPRSIDARLFHRCAIHRFEDAQILLTAERTTGAMYLAGYTIECALKALILNQLPQSKQTEMLGFFRGAKAHDYEWLLGQYRSSGGPRFPKAIAVSFRLLTGWSSELRYVPRTFPFENVTEFTQAAKKFLEWAQGRI